MRITADIENTTHSSPLMAEYLSEGEVSVLNDFIKMFKQAEIACGPTSLKAQNLPAIDSELSIKTQWFRQASSEIVRYIIGSEKNRKFRFGIKSERALINQRESFLKTASKKLCTYQKKHKISKAEYDAQLKAIDSKIEKYECLSRSYAEDSVNKVRTIDALQKAIKDLRALRDSYSHMEIINEQDNNEPCNQTDLTDQTEKTNLTDRTDSPDTASRCKKVANRKDSDKESSTCHEEKSITKVRT